MTLAIIIVAINIMSCESKSKKQPNNVDLLKSEINKAQLSKQIEKKLFLGFSFGMTDKDIVNHLDSLKHTGKIKIDNEGKFYYDFNTNSITLLLYFLPSYKNDSLYKMDYLLKSGESIGSSSLNTVLAAGVFMKSKDSNFKSFVTDNVIGETEYTFIKNNLIVNFHEGGTSGVMSYINAPVDKQVADLKDSTNNRNLHKTLLDFK